MFFFNFKHHLQKAFFDKIKTDNLAICGRKTGNTSDFLIFQNMSIWVSTLLQSQGRTQGGGAGEPSHPPEILMRKYSKVDKMFLI